MKTPVVTISNRSRAAIRKMEEDELDMERFVQETIMKGKPWTDPEFQPKKSSLYDPSIDQVDQSTYDSFTWKRASKIYNPLYIFEDGVEPNDIN